MPPASPHALKVFESVARLGNLSSAAVELHIAVGAVSHQLRTLQDTLGVRLFEKQGRRLIVTRRGALLQQVVFKPITSIETGLRDLSSGDDKPQGIATLKLCLPLVLAPTWLSSRLFQFLEDNHRLRLKIDFSVRFETVDWKRTDVAIVYGNPPWQGFWWRMLHGVRLTPVCSP
jgi:LysR family glycine cleavage system transcriptional activator